MPTISDHGAACGIGNRDPNILRSTRRENMWLPGGEEQKLAALEAIKAFHHVVEHEEVHVMEIEDEAERRYEASCLIQRAWRKKAARLEMDRRKVTLEQQVALEKTAAIMMQSLVRGIRGRRHSAIMRGQRDKEHARASVTRRSRSVGRSSKWKR